ncbi:MAG: hypothetical protein ACK4NC_03055 [Candidatus Gracilibacteria bacterium]
MSSENFSLNNSKFEGTFSEKKFNAFDNISDKLKDFKTKNDVVLDNALKVVNGFDQKKIDVKSFNIKPIDLNVGGLVTTFNSGIEDKKNEASNLLNTATELNNKHFDLNSFSLSADKNNIFLENAKTINNAVSKLNDAGEQEKFTNLSKLIRDPESAIKLAQMDSKEVTPFKGNIYQKEMTINGKKEYSYFSPVNKDHTNFLPLYKAFLNQKEVYVSQDLSRQLLDRSSSLGRLVFDDKGNILNNNSLQNDVDKSRNFMKVTLEDLFKTRPNEHGTGLIDQDVLLNRMNTIDHFLTYNPQGQKINEYIKQHKLSNITQSAMELRTALKTDAQDYVEKYNAYWKLLVDTSSKISQKIEESEEEHSSFTQTLEEAGTMAAQEEYGSDKWSDKLRDIKLLFQNDTELRTYISSQKISKMQSTTLKNYADQVTKIDFKKPNLTKEELQSVDKYIRLLSILKQQADGTSTPRVKK